MRRGFRAFPVAGSPLDSTPMRVRIFGHYWQLSVVLLWLLESAAIFGSSTFTFRWMGSDAESVIWVQSFILAGCVMVAAIAMGLFSRRLRDRPTGLVLRIAVSVLGGAVLGGLLLYV